MRRLLIALLLLHPAIGSSTTGPDLRARIQIDGSVADYQPDEWILDAATDPRESPDDSRWGADSEIRRIAVTWDERFLYIAAEAGAFEGVLMAALACAPGGVTNLTSAGEIRRNVYFAGIAPNLLIMAEDADLEAVVASVSRTGPLRYLDPDRYESRLLSSDGGAAFEIAIPWQEASPSAGALQLVALLTGGAGSGAGDSAPDPSGFLSSDRNAPAWLDISAGITIDADLDGVPDAGVSPRARVSFGTAEPGAGRAGHDIELRLESASFAPDAGEALRFQIVAAPDLPEEIQLFVTCEIFRVSGERVRVLFQEQPRVFGPDVLPAWEEWDGRDDSANVVEGGIFVVHVSSGPAPGKTTSTSQRAAAVIR
jgi:hypothetical protein